MITQKGMELIKDMKHEIDNILVSSKNGVLTQKDLQIAINEYLDLLPNPELINTKVQCFNGLVRYLYNRCIKPIIDSDERNIDYILLDTVFENVFIPLCQSYGYTPNAMLFCTLVNIPNSSISGIYDNNGNNTIYNNSDSIENGNKVISNRYKIVKKWRDILESNLVSNVIENSNIGSIFLLKSMYQYSENSTIKIDINNELPQIDAKQLAAIAQANIPGRDHE